VISRLISSDRATSAPLVSLLSCSVGGSCSLMLLLHKPRQQFRFACPALHDRVHWLLCCAFLVFPYCQTAKHRSLVDAAVECTSHFFFFLLLCFQPTDSAMKFESKLVPFLLLGGLRLTHGVLEQEACAAHGVPTDSERRLTRESGRDLAVVGGAVITNGVVKLGIFDEGHLNVYDNTEGSLEVGIRWDGVEATAHGCTCEGWGASATGSTGPFSGYANDDSGTANLAAQPIIVTGDSAFVDVMVTSGPGTLRVTHNYEPAPETPNLYVATVTFENKDLVETLTNLRYRRVMDWDIPPDLYNECVSIDTGTAKSLEYASDDGFVSSNPLGAFDSILFSCPTGGVGCAFFDSGPNDHGALFQFLFKNEDESLVTLAPGETFTFKIYYGGAANKVDAVLAIQAVGAEVSRVKISSQ
jgi:hypothetical protein